MTLFLLAIFAAIGFLWTEALLASRRPIEWSSFTPELRTRLLRDGKTVLLFAKPRYHAGTFFAASTTFQDERMRRANHFGRFVALHLEYDQLDETLVKLLFDEYKPTQHPFVAIYSPGGQTTFVSPYFVDDILENIPEPRRSPIGLILLTTAPLITAVIWKLRQGRARRLKKQVGETCPQS